MEEKIFNIISKCLRELNEELENPNLDTISGDTIIFGGVNGIDSLSLVSFIADVEEQLQQEFDKYIVLADEKAMSAKSSPFRRVETLQIYIQKLLGE